MEIIRLSGERIVLLILDQESGKIAIIFENNSLKVMIVELRKTAVKR